jgi:Pyridine nucleotide-disulphide oxidoreductase, dimerisation domain
VRIDDRILGFAMIGSEAGEVMAVVHTAILAGLLYSRLADAAFAPPTMAEGLGSLFSQVPARPAQETTTLPINLSLVTNGSADQLDTAPKERRWTSVPN